MTHICGEYYVAHNNLVTDSAMETPSIKTKNEIKKIFPYIICFDSVLCGRPDPKLLYCLVKNEMFYAKRHVSPGI